MWLPLPSPAKRSSTVEADAGGPAKLNPLPAIPPLCPAAALLCAVAVRVAEPPSSAKEPVPPAPDVVADPEMEDGVPLRRFRNPLVVGGGAETLGMSNIDCPVVAAVAAGGGAAVERLGALVAPLPIILRRRMWKKDQMDV